MRLRHLIIRILNPLVWRISPKRKLAALQEFSNTELDSGWQSLYALKHLKDPKAKAALFHHALEEFYHADLFSHLQSSYSDVPLNQPVFTREAVLVDGGDKNAMLDFLVEVYVGESEINRDFAKYAKAPVDESIRALFRQIKAEEEGHEDLSRELLLQYADGDEGKLRWLIFKKQLSFAYKRYERSVQGFGHFMLSLWLAIIYYAFGGFFFGLLRKRLRFSRENQAEILKEQARMLAGGSK
jgi:rubrerythrin